MKASLVTFFSAFYLASAVVVVEINTECIDPLIGASGIDDTLSKDEYKSFMGDLVKNSSPLYDEIDFTTNAISTKLDAIFDNLVSSCPVVFAFGSDQENCGTESIHVGGAADDNVSVSQKYFVFRVCEASLEFLNEEVRSEAPSQAPSASQLCSFNNTMTVQIKREDSLQDLDIASAGEQLETAVERYLQELMDSPDFNDVQFAESESFKPKTIVNCQVKKNLSDISFENFICYEYTIQTSVRISDQCSTNSAIKKLEIEVNTAYREGVIQKYLCPEERGLACQIITIILKNIIEPAVVLGYAFGVVGIIFLIMGYKTCKCGPKSNQKDDYSEIEVEFPVPKLPREDERIQFEQQTSF